MRLRSIAVLAGFVSVCAHAATFTVTNLNDSGAGSLRQAIADANANAGADTVAFAVNGTIVLTSGAILVTDALTIQGPGPAALIVDGNANNRIFTVIESGAPACPALTGPSDFLVSVSGLTLRNGQRNVANSSGGAILSVKSLVVDNVTFENNRAKSGGAVWVSLQYPSQAVSIANSRFLNNEAREIVAGSTGTHIGGAFGMGENCSGARTMPATVTIADSLFSGNVAQASGVNARGGAIGFFHDADVTMTRTRLVANRALLPASGTATALGGGLYGRAKSLTVRDSEIADNEADVASGFGVVNELDVRQTFAERMSALIVNSTIANNRAYSSVAVYAFGNVELDVVNSTIVGNRTDAYRTGGISLATGPTSPPSAADATPPTLSLDAAVVWNPFNARDLAKSDTTMGGAFVVTANQSIVGRLCDTICGPGLMTLAGAGNRVGVDPLLGLLQLNGGTTRTRLPQLGSPAIDSGSNVLGLATDQRGAGFPRTINGATDVGAVEYAPLAQCDGFADVAGNSPFCASVSWMKGRNVTLGCGGGNYCPNDPVSRLQMAAFMTRLGLPLSGSPEMRAEAPGPLDFASSPVVCTTAAIAAATAPRRATLDAVFAGIAPSDSFARATIVASNDGGATWLPVQFFFPRATFKAGRWVSLHTTTQYDIAATLTLRFGLRLDRGTLTDPSAVSDSTCRLRARIDNSHGFTLP